MGQSGQMRCSALIDGQEVVVDGVDGLAALARAGRIGSATQVRVGGSDVWTAADRVPELSRLFAAEPDPWAAWDELDPDAHDLDDGDPDPIESTDPGLVLTPVGPPLGDAPPRPPGVASEPDVDDEETGDPPTDRGELVRVLGTKLDEVPADALKPVGPGRDPLPSVASARLDEPSLPPVIHPPRGPSASPAAQDRAPRKVIAFPKRSRPPVSGANALAPADPLPFARPGPPPMPVFPEPKPRVDTSAVPRVRWWALGLFAVVAVGAMLSMRFYVTNTAGAVFRGPGAGDPVASTSALPAGDDDVGAIGAPTGEEPVGAGGASADAGSAEARIEIDLRNELMPGVQDVTAPGDLEVALLIELRRVHVDVVRVDAPVKTWTGPKRDVPDVADIRIQYRSHPGELVRELAAVGLVVGKYIEHYRMDVERFELVVDGLGPVSRRLTPESRDASRFYLQRVPLETYVDGLLAR